MNTPHQQLVIDLAKPGQDIIKGLTPKSAHCLHMAVGLSGEVAELAATRTVDNLIEEFGDIEFFLEGLTLPLQIPRRDYRLAVFTKDKNSPTQAMEHLMEMMILAGHILDSVKKWVIYEKTLDVPTLENQIRNFDKSAECCRRVMGVELMVAREANITKLQKRYKLGRYSNQAAQDRADKPQGE